MASVEAAVINEVPLWNFVERCPGAPHACVKPSLKSQNKAMF